MLQTCYARQEPSINNRIESTEEKNPGVVLISSETTRDIGVSGLDFGGYLERFGLDELDQGFPSNHHHHHHPHTHQSNRSTSSQASSSSSSFSSTSQTDDRGQTHPTYPYSHVYPHTRSVREDREEVYIEGDAGRMPEMDSPGKTSDLSSSMWSVRGLGSQ